MADSKKELLPIELGLEGAARIYAKRVRVFASVVLAGFFILILLPLCLMQYTKLTIFVLVSSGIVGFLLVTLPSLRNTVSAGAEAVRATVSVVVFRVMLVSVKTVLRILNIFD